MLRQKKIGILGGTFDPIHFGHINLALGALEKCELDEVWFCPAALNPHKQDTLPTSVFHRLEMVSLALDCLPFFKVYPWESEQPGPSYTIDTVQHLIDLPNAQTVQYFLIMGDDVLFGIERWHQIERLAEIASFIVGSRSLERPLPLITNPLLAAKLKQGKISIPLLDISATDIRQRMREKKYVGHLMPLKVIDYIHRYSLY